MVHDITVRRAESRDIVKLSEVFDHYRRFYKRESDLEAAQRFLTERIVKNESTIFIAESSEGELLGFVQLYPSFTSLGMARTWILNDLYVIESARRLGIGRRLVDVAHEHARATGARSISLETQQSNTKAKSLYESLGYERETQFLFYSKTIEACDIVMEKKSHC